MLLGGFTKPNAMVPAAALAGAAPEPTTIRLVMVANTNATPSTLTILLFIDF